MRAIIQVGDCTCEIPLVYHDRCPGCGSFGPTPLRTFTVRVVSGRYEDQHEVGREVVPLPLTLQRAAEQYCAEFLCACRYEEWRRAVWGETPECAADEHEWVSAETYRSKRFRHCRRCGFIPPAERPVRVIR